jgi:hypothetical protein
MSDEYTPRDGTVAHTIVEFLRKQGPGVQFTGLQLETKLKVKHAATSLRKAVDAGLVDLEKQGRTCLYSHPAPPQPPDGKLHIAAFSDGDVSIAGGTSNEDGSTTYTRDQVVQLIRFVTQPTIGSIVEAQLLPSATTTLLPASGGAGE